MGPIPSQFTGIVTAVGAQTFLQTNGEQALLLTGPGPSVAQQIAAATAMFAPVVGTLQTISGFVTDPVAGQPAILVV